MARTDYLPEIKTKHVQLNHQFVSMNEDDYRRNGIGSILLRVRRAASWVNHDDDDLPDDIAFVFYWIAFDALYGYYDPQRKDEEKRREFFERITRSTHSRLLVGDAIEECNDAIEHIMNSKFTYDGFWQYYRGSGNHDWEKKKKAEVEEFRRQVCHREYARALPLLFRRLYCVRNQLFHGSSTSHGSSDDEHLVNLGQVRQSRIVLAELMPILLHAVLEVAATGDCAFTAPVYPGEKLKKVANAWTEDLTRGYPWRD